jgi:hypothetical protein
MIRGKIILRENTLKKISVVLLGALALGIWLWSQIITFHPVGGTLLIFRSNALTGCVTILDVDGESRTVCG